jgi:predicted CopG family antitoxin
MSFKTISINTTVYRQLRSQKRAGESFTDVIARLLGQQQPPLSRHAGAWKPMARSEIEDVRRRVDELRHHGTQERALR